MYGIFLDEGVVVGPFHLFSDASHHSRVYGEGGIVCWNHPSVLNAPKRAPWDQVALVWPIR